MVTAATDLGHQAPLSSGTWANGNPSAVVDFAYSSMHKTTLVTKALVTAFYGKAPTKSYYQGCSDGGREGLQEAQRYPADFDGIVVGSPVIDEVPTNSFYHGWNVHVNSDANQQAIVTADKIPTLVSFVQSSCADKGGLIQDPRACKPDLTKIQCPNGTNTAQCLTAAQISVVQQIWNGPIDENGNHLTAGDMPIGGEANWLGTMVPKTLGAPMTPANVSDAVWSSDGGLSFQHARRFGAARAFDIFLQRESIDAHKAYCLSLVQRAVEPPSLYSEPLDVASKLASTSAHAVREIKALLADVVDEDPGRHLDREKEAFLRCASTNECRRKVKAFVSRSKVRVV